jgi:putative proteasome-type protease
VIHPDTSTHLAVSARVGSFDSTMRSNLSVGMPIDLLLHERDRLAITQRRRFCEGDDWGDNYFRQLSGDWSEGVRKVFRELPDLVW